MDNGVAARLTRIRLRIDDDPHAANSESSTLKAGRCRLLELPAELREQIWIHTVAEYAAETAAPWLKGKPTQQVQLLRKVPIRMDRFNRPLPASVTRTCRQTRHESLALYYKENIFECWRPLWWIHKDASFSTFVNWLQSLGSKRQWLNHIVLLYKHDNELDHDLQEFLYDLGLELNPGVLYHRQELSELEMSHEAMGLPRHFGKKRRDRWWAGSASTT